jgi:hypothetical protein
VADREIVDQIAARLPPSIYCAGDRGPNHQVGFGAPDQGALVSVRGGHERWFVGLLLNVYFD